jgi:hypothetical protein
MFYFKSIFREKRDYNRQDSLSPEPQTPFAKGAKMNSSMVVVIGIGVMIVVFAIIGFVAMWRERH